MYGVVTRNEEEIEWDDFGIGFYEVKDVSGRAAEPLSNAVNMVSCFGDNTAANSDPELVPINEDGTLATREQPYFDWGYICPTHDEYRSGLLEIIEDSAAVNDAVRLDDVGFPREGYCRCDRCQRQFNNSTAETWQSWRDDIITEFVETATTLIPGRTYFTLYPDPYPGHLSERSGINVERIAKYVDEFVIPLYDIHYGTTYWLETIVKGFQSRIDSIERDVDISVELYAVDVDVDDLIHATEVADAYSTNVYFGYDASNAAAALRRMNADNRDGVTHRPD